VLEAADGVGAAKIWTEKDGQIDLLFSDMVIPGQLNGLELAQQFKRAKPDLRVVLTSGYVSEAKMNGDLKQLGFSYLAKPFIWEDLAEALRSTVRLPE
jgi:DNA-binding NtrC family response regulator